MNISLEQAFSLDFGEIYAFVSACVMCILLQSNYFHSDSIDNFFFQIAIIVVIKASLKEKNNTLKNRKKIISR